MGDKVMQNIELYNEFITELEAIADGGLFFHRIEHEIYITDYRHRLLGIWNIKSAQPCQLREQQI
jgi:hypothetical protein